jgi:hypothetical protein
MSDTNVAEELGPDPDEDAPANESTAPKAAAEAATARSTEATGLSRKEPNAEIAALTAGVRWRTNARKATGRRILGDLGTDLGITIVDGSIAPATGAAHTAPARRRLAREVDVLGHGRRQGVAIRIHGRVR